MQFIPLGCSSLEYDEELDVLTTNWVPVRPCKVGEMDGPLQQAMIPPKTGDTYDFGVEFIGRRSDLLAVVVPQTIRFHGLKNWPKVSNYWLQTSIAPFELHCPQLELDTKTLAYLFAQAYKKYVAKKPLKK